MGWFKRGNSEEYEKLYKKIVEITAKIDENSYKIGLLSTDLDNLRGNFNRKLSGIRRAEREEEAQEETKDLKSQVILPHKW